MCSSFAVVQCSSLAVSGKMNISCSGEPVFGAVCAFACPEGWTLNGSAALMCDATGHWSGMLPTCEGEALIGTGCLGDWKEEGESNEPFIKSERFPRLISWRIFNFVVIQRKQKRWQVTRGTGNRMGNILTSGKRGDTGQRRETK